MDFRLSEEQELLRKTAREFADKEVAPRAKEIDREMPCIERRECGRDESMQGLVERHHACRDPGHDALGPAAAPGSIANGTQQEGDEHGDPHPGMVSGAPREVNRPQSTALRRPGAVPVTFGHSWRS